MFDRGSALPPLALIAPSASEIPPSPGGGVGGGGGSALEKCSSELRDLPPFSLFPRSSRRSSSGVHPGQRLRGEDHPQVAGAGADLRDHHSVRGTATLLLLHNRLAHSGRLFVSHAPCWGFGEPLFDSRRCCTSELVKVTLTPEKWLGLGFSMSVFGFWWISVWGVCFYHTVKWGYTEITC